MSRRKEIPSSGDVDVWLCRPVDLDPSELERLRELLSTEEQRRLDRFLAPRAQLEGLISRALLRTALSSRSDVDPRDWRFTPSSRGRPEIVVPTSASGLAFSISHTDGLVACAVARHAEVGVDVESVERDGDLPALARRYFSAEESAAIDALPNDEARVHFLGLWTLKESYFKARGLPVATGLDRARFELRGSLVRFSVDPDLDAGEAWRFALCRWRGHFVTVADRPPRAGRIEFFSWTPAIGAEPVELEVVADREPQKRNTATRLFSAFCGGFTDLL